MIIDVVKYLKSQMLYHLPIYSQAFHLARKDEKGRIIYKADTDYQYSGISDRQGSYFYLRYLEGEGSEYSEGSRTFASCATTTEVTTRIKLVSVISDPGQCGQDQKHQIEEDIRKALNKINFLGFTGSEHRIRIQVTKSSMDPVTIIREESGGDARPFGNDWLIHGLEFELRFLDIQGAGVAPGSSLVGQAPPAGPEDCCDSLVIEQLAPAQTWAMAHNLDKYPSVTVVGLDWKTIDQPLIHFIDTNNVAISFDEAFTGRAIFN